MQFNLKHHAMEITIIFSTIILFYFLIPSQISLILLCVCMAMLGLLAVIGLSSDMEIEEARALVVIKEESQSDNYPYNG